MSSPYTVPTGDGYEGTFTVRDGDRTRVNLVTAGLERGETVVLTRRAPRLVGIHKPGAVPDTDEALRESEVSDNGYTTIVKPALEVLDVDAGDDIRLYDRPAQDGLVVAPGHPDDPFLDGEVG